jgi:hypothetical protein
MNWYVQLKYDGVEVIVKGVKAASAIAVMDKVRMMFAQRTVEFIEIKQQIIDGY